MRRWYALVGLLVPIFGLAGHAQKPAEKPPASYLVDRSLTVTPAKAPVPALRYRLFPLSSERKAGNAVPMYLRFAHERTDATKKALDEKPAAWLKVPLEKLPLAEVKAFLQGHQYNLRQLDLGARRTTADWSYSLDAGNPMNMRLGDAQEMRMHARLLALKARVEIVEGRYADAVRTLETGFSFARQVCEAPLLISGLVGVACGAALADCVQELIERPDAPNLYWALAAVPRPLIDFRRAAEVEMKLLEMQLPDVADLDRPRSAEEWAATLKRVRLEVERIMKDEPGVARTPPGARPDDPADKSPDLEAARAYLTAAGVADAAHMPAARVLLVYLARYNREVGDDYYKAMYLPLHQSGPVMAAADRRLREAPDTEAARIARYFLPALAKVRVTQGWLERKLAALQAVEALRLYAAANGGRLPDRLDQVTLVPVPEDPGTGRPFEYVRDGAASVLTSRVPGEPVETAGLRLRVTVRK